VCVLRAVSGSQFEKRQPGPHSDKQVLEITKGRSRSRDGGKNTVDAGTTDISASKTEIPSRDSTTTMMRAGLNQSASEPQGELHLDGSSTAPVDERAAD